MNHPAASGDSIRLLDFGLVPPVRSQAVYHATAHTLGPDSPDTVILVSTDRPYVCIGYHQDLEKEVDLDYCRANGLPVVRREVGGGAVYLDSGQVFIQWVFQPGHLPQSIEDRYELYVRPLVETYQDLGVAAYLRPVNDIHVAGKKIGGTGAAQIGPAEVVVGSLMFTFDKATMARVLKVSSEKMRDKIFESLEQYMTTLEEQLGQLPDRQAVCDIYLAKMAVVLGRDIVPGVWTEAEEATAAGLDASMVAPDWLYQKGALRQSGVKIHEDVQVVEGSSKAPGGLIRASVRMHQGQLDAVEFSGDFTLFPAAGVDGLARSLEGLPAQPDTLRTGLAHAYATLGIHSPGITPDHFAAAVLAALES